MSEKLHPTTTRILIAEKEQFAAEKVTEALAERGFQVRLTENGAQALAISKTWKPHFVLYDMLMLDMNGPSFLKQMAAENLLGDGNGEGARVFVMSSHNSTANVKECLKFGASDYLVKPVKPEELISRLVLHMQPKRQVAETKAGDTSVSGSALHYMHLTELLLRESLKLAPQPEALFNLVGMLSLVLGAVRVSVIQATLDKPNGTVRASSDKRDIDGLNLDLVKYPEVVFVLRSEKTLALDNLKGDATMAAVAEQTKSINFNAMVVCPLRFGGEMWGVVSVRLPDTKKALTDFEIRFAQLTSQVIANVVVRNLAATGGLPGAGSTTPPATPAAPAA